MEKVEELIITSPREGDEIERIREAKRIINTNLDTDMSELYGPLCRVLGIERNKAAETFIDEDLADALHDWRTSTFDAEDYYGAIFDKFGEMLDKHGINLNVHDGEEAFSNTDHKAKDYSSESLDKKNQKSFKEVEEIAKEFDLDYNQAIDFWNKMNKKFIADRNPLNPLNFKEDA